MDTLIQADIFFFVTTVSVALLTVLLVIAWIYVIRILSDLKRLSEKARVEGEFIVEEVGELRERLKDEGFGMKALLRFIRRIFSRYR